MPIGDVCIRDVVVASRETTAREAARLMAENHVGNLVVVEDIGGRRVPVGIITDRDIVRNVVAEALDASVFSLGDLGVRELVTTGEHQGIYECMQQMRINGIRRMPVVDGKGALVGIISLDDLIQLLAEEMSELAKVITREQARETVRRG
jgi:CBS domain-containing protein